jgi:hypothetical protein
LGGPIGTGIGADSGVHIIGNANPIFCHLGGSRPETPRQKLWAINAPLKIRLQTLP